MIQSKSTLTALVTLGVFLLSLSPTSQACAWSVSDGWVRFVSTSSMGGAYAQFENLGNKPVSITSIISPAFGSIESHQSVLSEGKMQMLPYQIQLEPHAKLMFEPKGKHLMLFDPVKPLSLKSHLSIRFTDNTGCVVSGDFEVREII
jgi:periplasmic copper chaperone A